MVKFLECLSVEITGASHCEALILQVDGLPAGLSIDMDALTAFLKRRSPGRALTSARREPDDFVLLSGLQNGRLTGETLSVRFPNHDVRSKDYENPFVPRPGHADFAARARFGFDLDLSGGGRFSARMTLPLCFLGGICLQLLHQRGITVGAHLLRVGSVCDRPFDPVALTPEELADCAARFPAVLNPQAGCAMADAVRQAGAEGDSLGGILEGAVLGLKPGMLGGPLFDGLESLLSAALFALPAVKGVSFGSGFAGACRTGSQNNDPFVLQNGAVTCEKNDAGGILGGICTGLPLVFSVAVKPTPSIARPQQSVDLKTRQPVVLEIRGRHDPCAALRAVPCVEAVAAICFIDLFLKEGLIHGA